MSQMPSSDQSTLASRRARDPSQWCDTDIIVPSSYNPGNLASIRVPARSEEETAGTRTGLRNLLPDDFASALREQARCITINHIREYRDLPVGMTNVFCARLTDSFVTSLLREIPAPVPGSFTNLASSWRTVIPECNRFLVDLTSIPGLDGIMKFTKAMEKVTRLSLRFSQALEYHLLDSDLSVPVPRLPGEQPRRIAFDLSFPADARSFETFLKALTDPIRSGAMYGRVPVTLHNVPLGSFRPSDAHHGPTIPHGYLTGSPGQGMGNYSPVTLVFKPLSNELGWENPPESQKLTVVRDPAVM